VSGIFIIIKFWLVWSNAIDIIPFVFCFVPGCFRRYYDVVVYYFFSEIIF
jgi:hypothetical protein